MPQTPHEWMLVGVGIVAGLAVAIGLVLVFRRQMLGRARREAQQALSDAERDAATRLKQADTDIREKQIELRQQVEKESRETRKELLALEKRILAKEEAVDKRVDTLERKTNDLNAKEEQLANRERDLDRHKEELAQIIEMQTKRLEEVSGLTADQAKRDIYTQLETEVRRDSALRLKRIEEELVEKADKKGKWILGQAIQRCAADHVTESVVSVVNLPSDEMKGRIIGREGRNIRALESATGINIIIDDTPEAVILSGFDPIRREVARISLERLITDGRIHPARIEEVVAKVSDELAKTVREVGEQVCLEVDVHGLPADIVKLLGQLTYRTSYGQNVLQHSKEVCHLAGLMASEMGLPIAEAKRAGLIHDIGKAVNHEVEGSHAAIGRDIARRHGENDVVCNAIGGHHNEEEQKSVIAVLVQAADALSAARPGARRETIETYVKRLEQLEDIADAFPGVEKSYALQAGREIRVAVHPDKIDDAQASQLARDVARKVESEMTYPGQITVTVIRETRAVDMAK